LYAAGASVSGGRFRFLDGRTPNELSTWITVAPSRLKLTPHGSAAAVVTIALPRSALDGERYAVVWAQTPPSHPPDGGLATINRVGIRVYLSVGRGQAPATDFQIDSLTARRETSGHPIVAAVVANTGGRAIDLTGELRLTAGPGGLSAGPFPVAQGTTLGIGQRAAVPIQLNPAIPDGPWTADLTLRSDGVERRARALIRFPAVADARPSPVPATHGGLFGSLGPIAAISAVALAVWLLLVAWRRRGSKRNDSRDWETHLASTR
jgi:hypothetical protein